MKLTKLTFLCLIPLLIGCESPVRDSIGIYNMAADRVAIGDSKERVLRVLGSPQGIMPSSQTRRPESYEKDGKLVEIYFYRSSIQNDGILTDDEFTPYIFEDGILVAIGWTYLGGPKTQAQPTPEPDIRYQYGYGWGWYPRWYNDWYFR